jgi:hypothetical protein
MCSSSAGAAEVQPRGDLADRHGVVVGGMLAADVCRADVSRAGQIDVADGTMAADDGIMVLG